MEDAGQRSWRMQGRGHGGRGAEVMEDTEEVVDTVGMPLRSLRQEVKADKGAEVGFRPDPWVDVVCWRGGKRREGSVTSWPPNFLIT